MLKRLSVAAMVILFVLGFAGLALASNTATWRIDLAVLVEPRVEKAESGGCTLPASYSLNMIEQDEDEEETSVDWFEAFYANVPVVITVVGDNDAGDGVPIPARVEHHADGTHKTRYDRLSIELVIKTRVNNGDGTQEAEEEITFESPTQYGSGAPTEAGWVGSINTMTLPTPHDGEIEEYFKITVDRKPPDCDEDNEHYESADAGEYSCYFVQTVVGQDTPQSHDAY